MSLEDEMDPLFDNDWHHEHNLDLLFDLFEEEVERKGLESAAASSSTIFGSSPVTSYLFGTSPSLVSALDLYDLLYFDQQQPAPIVSSSPLVQNQGAVANSNTSSVNQHHTQASIINSNSSFKTETHNVGNPNSGSSTSSSQRQHVSASHIANSITNAMKIKRGMRRGQSEGISLLARPLVNNKAGDGGGMNNNKNNNNTINNSDKTSVRVTNLKRPMLSKGCSGGIDINYSKQNQHGRNRHHLYHQHAHYMTGCAIIREHAYAVRGH